MEIALEPAAGVVFRGDHVDHQVAELGLPCPGERDLASRFELQRDGGDGRVDHRRMGSS